MEQRRAEKRLIRAKGLSRCLGGARLVGLLGVQKLTPHRGTEKGFVRKISGCNAFRHAADGRVLKHRRLGYDVIYDFTINHFVVYFSKLHAI